MKNENKRIKTSKSLSRTAQSIIELSLLGAALLSILGILIKVTTMTSQSESIQLKAMREALKLSAQEALREQKPENKGTQRKSTQVLWIDDRSTIEGGEKYGSSSRTPTIAMGSGTFTNLLEYPMRYYSFFKGPLPRVDNQTPTLEMYINGKQFTFTLGAFKQYGGGWRIFEGSSFDEYSKPLDNYPACDGWDQQICDNSYDPGGRPHCMAGNGPVLGTKDRWWAQELHYLPSSPTEPPQVVFYKKIFSTDKNFCVKQQEPTDHYCDHNFTTEELNERFRYKFNTRLPDGTMSSIDLGPDGGIVLGDDKRREMTWQWFPVLATLYADKGWWGDDGQGGMAGLQNVDVDFDGNEETVLHAELVGYVNEADGMGEECHRWYGVFAGKFGDSRDYAKGAHCEGFGCGDSKGCGSWWKIPWRLKWLWVYDSDEGDLNLNYTASDRAKGLPQPGLTSGKAKITTVAAGDLNISQAFSSDTGKATLVSLQKKDTINIIEREIQLSNNTGRFSTKDANGKYPGGDVDMACYAEGCCNLSGNQYKTCFDATSRILYVRSLTEDRVGHKFITIDIPKQFP
jgi:hypothetical protein